MEFDYEIIMVAVNSLEEKMGALKVGELINLMKNSFLKENSAGVNTSIQMNLTGEGGGQWFLIIKNQNLDIQPGTFDDARAEVEMDAEDFLSIISGELDPLKAFFGGRIHLTGNQNAVIKLLSLFSVKEEDLKKLRS
jgi:putative sterol carrier protein